MLKIQTVLGIAAVLWCASSAFDGRRAKAASKPAGDVPKTSEKLKVWKWRKVQLGGLVELKGGASYCARIDLGWPDSLAAEPADVRDVLMSKAKWSALAVWGQAETVPSLLPLAKGNETGRFWALGTPEKTVKAQLPEVISELWTAD